ncbi:hypothetical protein F5J12DRAFT_783926 [Pisolithus orientalis]|uniref:uncharacterized protein n=1 Tax=Pisolithus orientalis TaxID=936130 RepID=UPI0022240FD2|nr:uncharacterized protein F5J12DRAFT_783926 [Pisolithus orientalis]KAI6002470.1 hypothetical protein F5J12DRAFT_783926 [Pisolithus orientalis]
MNRWNWKEYCAKILEVMQIQNVEQVLVGMKPKPRPGSNELKEWPKSSRTVDSILMWNMPDSIFSCIKYYETACEMFNYLATTYGNPNPISIPVKCVSAPAEQSSIGKDEPIGTNEPEDETLVPHVKPDKLSSEPPKEVTLEGNSHDEGGEVELKTLKSTKDALCQCASPVKFKRVKSVKVEGEMSREVSKERAAESSLGKEATDKADSMDITAKKTMNLEADGGDTEVHHTSNGPECMHKRKVHASAQDTPNDLQTTGNMKDTGGSTDVLQHHTGDPGHCTHERGHAVGETSCKGSDGHAEPKVMAEQCKCKAIKPVPDLILQMEAHTAKNLLQTPTNHQLSRDEYHLRGSVVVMQAAMQMAKTPVERILKITQTSQLVARAIST